MMMEDLYTREIEIWLGMGRSGNDVEGIKVGKVKKVPLEIKVKFKNNVKI